MVLDLLAPVAMASGHAERAARLLGTAEQLWHTVGNPPMGAADLIAIRNACEEQARRLIGDDAYRSAFRAGYDTDPDTGIAYALTTPGDLPPVH